MPMAGKGMLLTSMNIDAAHEAEFNRWYDREHLEERVAIPGFLEARRYVAHDGNPKYLSLYSTETFEVLDSPTYRTALANQTAWSKANIANFKDMIRGVSRITISSAPAAARPSASSGCGRLPAVTTSCVLHCGINSIRPHSTVSSPCICWRTTRRCRNRSPTIPQAPIPAPATGSC